MQKAALLVIASQINPKDVKELRDTFKSLDKKGDGIIDLAELREILDDGSGNQQMHQTLTNLFSKADSLAKKEKRMSSTINYTEFIAASMDRELFMKDEHLENAF